MALRMSADDPVGIKALCIAPLKALIKRGYLTPDPGTHRKTRPRHHGPRGYPGVPG